MKANEKTRQFRIGIINDTEWEPDEDFKVQLIDEITQQRLDGENTECVVIILDDDKPGSIGFPERFTTISKGKKDAFVVIRRFDGSAGSISCMVNTINDHDSVPGKRAAAAYKDFVPIKMRMIEFGPNKVEYKLKIPFRMTMKRSILEWKNLSLLLCS